MAYYNIETILAAAVADDATFTISYPAGTTQATFTGANAASDGIVIVNDNDKYLEGSSGFSISYDASEVTLTNTTGASLPAGTKLLIGLSSVGTGFENTFTEVGPLADLGGTLTGTVDGDMADIADIALSTSNTYTDAAVNTAVNAAVADANEQLKELQTKVNYLLTQLRTAGIIASS